MTASAAADSLLAVVVAALASPPSRRLVVVGQPTDPLKGEQIGVGFLRQFTGMPGAEQPGADAQCWGPQCAEFVVRLLRCAPTSSSEQDSDPAAMRAIGLQLMDEGAAIRLALASWEPPGFTSPRDVWVGNVVGLRPQGFGQAVEVRVHAAM